MASATSAAQAAKLVAEKKKQDAEQKDKRIKATLQAHDPQVKSEQKAAPSAAALAVAAATAAAAAASAASRPSSASSSSSSSASSSRPTSSPPPAGSRGGGGNGASLTPRSATKTMGGVDKAKFAPTVPAARRRSAGTVTAAGPPAPSLLNPAFKRERKQRERKPLPAQPKEKARVSFMAPSRDKVKMEAGATLSASQMTGGVKSTAAVKLENVKKEADLPVGSYYDEDDRLDNGDAHQYRPILMPFPDIRGEEVRYSVDEADQEHQRWKLDPNDTTLDEPKFMLGVKPKASLYAPLSASYPPLPAANWFEEILSDKVSSKVFFLQMPSHFPIKSDGKSSSSSAAAPVAAAPSPPPPAIVSPQSSPGKKDSTVRGAAAKKAAAAAAPSPEPATTSKSPEPVHVPDEEEILDPRLVAIEKKDVSSLNPEQRKLLQDQKAYLQSISKLFHNHADHAIKNAMPAGQLGTMQVYRSGKIKLKIGDITYQMARGTDQLFHQELVMMPAPGTGASPQPMYNLGPINKRVVCTLDTEAVLQARETAAQLASAVVAPPASTSPSSSPSTD